MPIPTETKDRAYRLDPEAWESYSGRPKAHKQHMEARRTASLIKAAAQLEDEQLEEDEREDEQVADVLVTISANRRGRRRGRDKRVGPNRRRGHIVAVAPGQPERLRRMATRRGVTPGELARMYIEWGLELDGEDETTSLEQGVPRSLAPAAPPPRQPSRLVPVPQDATGRMSVRKA